MQKSSTGKSILLAMVFGLLFLPQLQNTFHWLNEWTLKGDVNLTEKPTFQWSTWWEGSFQKQAEKHINEHFGFRNHLLRLNNQMAYTLDRRAKANGVVIGKEHYLYEEGYIEAYFGRNFIGHNAIYEKAFKLQKIKDTLQQLNIDLIIALASNKVDYFPEYIPEHYSQDSFSTRNRPIFKSLFEESGISVIDFNPWFIQMKPDSPYPLYGKSGTHWSRYAEYLVADSLINYLEQKRNIRMPHYQIDSIEIAIENKFRDNDIGEGMNLLFDLPTYPMAYPHVHIESDTMTTRPQVLVIGDSYYFGLFHFGFSKKIFNNGKFWYYNHYIYPAFGSDPKLVSKINIREEVEKQEAVILMATDVSLPIFAFGFIEQLYEAYYVKPAAKRTYEDWIEHYKHQILMNAEWIEKTKTKAQKWKISLEEMLEKDAHYMARNKQK